MARAIPKTIRWQHDGDYDQGGALDAADFRAWSLEVNGAAVLSVPRTWETDGQYEISTAAMPVFSEAGGYTIRLQLIMADDIESDYSQPATFTLEASKPTAPFGLSVA